MFLKKKTQNENVEISGLLKSIHKNMCAHDRISF